MTWMMGINGSCVDSELISGIFLVQAIVGSRNLEREETDLKPFLDEAILDADPIKQFKAWLGEAIEARIPQPDTMVLATASLDGKPSARVVLLKSFDERGFVFYTNYESRKGRDLASNPYAALTFFWAEMDRQVRIEGSVSQLTSLESDLYFASRPRDSQLSSLTSSQSQPVGSRAELDSRFDELRRKYDGKPIPRPDHWGGYRLRPEKMEFWQSRVARLNDRVLYSFVRYGKWIRTRLQP